MIDWKSAARTFFRRAEAKQAHLSNALDQLAPLLDEARDESFDSWQDSARHWHEVTKRERASLALVRLKNAELLQKIEELQKGAESVQKEPCDDDAQPSSNPGDFAALAERIAYADGKKPRDSEDGGWGSMRDAKRALFDARNTLEENPCWSAALRCEIEEAVCDLAAKDFDGLCAELLDVATVAMRWRRAVMERRSHDHKTRA